jgi:hypothetical protein
VSLRVSSTVGSLEAPSSHSRPIMPLCLLSRRLQFLGFPKLRSSFPFVKAMIALVFDPHVLQCRPSTSQPTCQEFRFCRRASYSFSVDFVHRIANVLAGRLHQLAVTQTTLFTFNGNPGSVPRSNAFVQGLLYPKLSVGSSPDRFTNNTRCLVCDVQATASCPTCDQDFCSAHLYLCSDCDNQYCGNCLDDHYSHGHWTDSDTSAELSRTQYFKSEETAFCDRVTSLLARNCSNNPRPPHARVIQCISLVLFTVFTACRYLYRLFTAGYLPAGIVLMEVSL